MSEFYPNAEDTSPISSPVVSRISRGEQQSVFVVRDADANMYGAYTTVEQAVGVCEKYKIHGLTVSRLQLNETYKTGEERKSTLLVDVLFPSGCIGC